MFHNRLYSLSSLILLFALLILSFMVDRCVPATNPQANCEEKWEFFENRCYKFYAAREDLSSYEEAMSKCRSVASTMMEFAVLEQVEFAAKRSTTGDIVWSQTHSNSSWMQDSSGCTYLNISSSSTFKIGQMSCDSKAKFICVKIPYLNIGTSQIIENDNKLADNCTECSSEYVPKRRDSRSLILDEESFKRSTLVSSPSVTIAVAPLTRRLLTSHPKFYFSNYGTVKFTPTRTPNIKRIKFSSGFSSGFYRGFIPRRFEEKQESAKNKFIERATQPQPIYVSSEIPQNTTEKSQEKDKNDTVNGLPVTYQDLSSISSQSFDNDTDNATEIITAMHTTTQLPYSSPERISEISAKANKTLLYVSELTTKTYMPTDPFKNNFQHKIIFPGLPYKPMEYKPPRLEHFCLDGWDLRNTANKDSRLSLLIYRMNRERYFNDFMNAYAPPSEYSCYKLFTKGKAFNSARDHCEVFGGRLVEISDAMEQETIRIVISNQMRIGEEYIYPKFWINKIPLNKDVYTDWMDGYPKFKIGHMGRMGGVGGPCLTVDRITIKMRNSVCDSIFGFVCEMKPFNGDDVSPMTISPMKMIPDDMNVDCPGDDTGRWAKFGEFCYFVTESQGTWWEVKNKCIDEGGELASIHSYEENYWLLKKLNMEINIDHFMWIGAAAHYHDGFAWSDGTVFNYMNWLDGEPNNAMGIEDCVSMYVTNSGFWNDDNCNRKSRGICKRHIEGKHLATPLTTVQPMGGCDGPKWMHISPSRCIRVISGNAVYSRFEATLRCKEEHPDAAIVSIHSDFEQAVVSVAVTGIEVNSVWIGLIKSRNIFLWLDKSPLVYTNWMPGMERLIMPLDGFSFYANESPEEMQEKCVEFQTGEYFGRWKRVNCNAKMGVICQKPADPHIGETKMEMCAPPYESFAKFEKSCYKAVEESKSWKDADESCRKMNATLVSIESYNENSFIWILIRKSYDGRRWIGLKNEKGNSTSKVFEWSDSYPVLYTKWKTGVLDAEGSEDGKRCVSMSSEHGEWELQDCETKMQFVCKHSENRRASSEKTDLSCPGDDWFDFGGSKCYYRETKELAPWYSALVRCHSKGGDLVSITTMQDIQDMKRIIKSSEINLWIGLLTEADGGLQWSDGSPFSVSLWEQGEPSHSIEHCVEMKISGARWNDMTCSILRGYVCSAMKVKSPPSINEAKIPDESQMVDGFQMKDGIRPNVGNCREGWIRMYNKIIGVSCIKAFEDPKSELDFYDSRSKCAKMGGNLATFQTYSDHAHLHLALSEIRNSAWIGDEFPYSDDKSYIFRWFKGYIAEINKGRSNSMYTARCRQGIVYNEYHGTRKRFCLSKRLGYVCQLLPDSSLKTDESRFSPKCQQPDEKFTMHGINCYKFVDKAINWQDAEAECASVGSHLMSAQFRNENDLISVLESSTGRNEKEKRKLWLGLKYENNTFRWSDGSPIRYANWRPMHPLPMGHDAKSCVSMSLNDGKWSSENCTEELAFICKYLSVKPRILGINNITSSSTISQSTLTSQSALITSPSALTTTLSGHFEPALLAMISPKNNSSTTAQKLERSDGASSVGLILSIVFCVIICVSSTVAAVLVFFYRHRRSNSASGIAMGVYGFDNVIYNSGRIENVYINDENFVSPPCEALLDSTDDDDSDHDEGVTSLNETDDAKGKELFKQVNCIPKSEIK